MPPEPAGADPVAHVPGLRKNGKTESCNPCRKSKLACDHQVPCGRCARLRRADQCVYDPSPTKGPSTTKRKRAVDGADSRPTNTLMSRTLSDHEGRSYSSSERPAERRSAPQRSSSTSSLRPQPNVGEARATDVPSFWAAGYPSRPCVRYRPGFQGKTAFSAILNELQPHLSESVVGDPSGSDHADVVIDPRYIEMGAEILSYLPPYEVSRQALGRYFEGTVSSSLHLPTVWNFHEGFWEGYGSLLEQPRSMDSLTKCAQHLSQNALRHSFPNAFPSSRTYMNALIDRWEMVGVLFTCFAFLGQLLPPADSLLQAILPMGVKAREYSRAMLECAEACLRLVDHLDTGLNVMVAFLAYRASSMQSYVGNRGDTNYTYWRRNVQLCGDMTALGLHRLPEYTSQQSGSLLFLEQQKVVFVVAFTHDKLMAIFLGRPPGLSKRYVTTHAVLDAEEDLLTMDDIDTIKANLNEYGYNRAGKIMRPTIIRAYWFASLVYEDILELSLGASPPDLYRVRQVKAQMEEQYRQQPASLHQRVDRDLFAHNTILHAFAAVEIQLIHLHQNFLLDRIEHGTENLHFGTAEEMLRIVLTFWNEREQYPGHQDDNHWTICCYGIPAASAIAVGLWKASDSPMFNPHSWRNSRSENVQNLSLFIACLDWVKPAEGNYELCQRTMRMLKDILDRILAPSQQTTPLQPLAPVDLASWDLDTFSLAGMPNFGNMEDLFATDWMNARGANFQ